MYKSVFEEIEKYFIEKKTYVYMYQIAYTQNINFVYEMIEKYS